MPLSLKIMCFILLMSLLMIPDSKADNLSYLSNKGTGITIRNFGKVNDCYYRGGQPKLSELCQLKSCGIKTIINLRKPFFYNQSIIKKEGILANELGINYVNIPLLQNKSPTYEQIECFFSIVCNPKNQPVYVHCDQGRDRTGIMTALYRIQCEKWDYEQAYCEMKYYGYHRFLFPNLKYFLQDYALCKCAY